MLPPYQIIVFIINFLSLLVWFLVGMTSSKYDRLQSSFCFILLLSSLTKTFADGTVGDVINDVTLDNNCADGRELTCNACENVYHVSTSSCCSDDMMFDFCTICITYRERCFPELSFDVENEDNEVDKRANYFLGKRVIGRSSYFLGKRPRNNFLGKRSGEFNVDNDMWEDSENHQTSVENKRRMKPFLGKRRQPFLGKRAKYFLGKREDGLEHNYDTDKYILGEQSDDSEYGLDEDKRAKYFLGKRSDEQNYDFDAEKRAKYFLGKRARYFLGKRVDDDSDTWDAIDDLKRAKYFLGKRRRHHFLGKRDADIVGKREANSSK